MKGLDLKIIGSLLLIIGILFAILIISEMYLPPSPKTPITQKPLTGNGSLMIPLDNVGDVVLFSTREDLMSYLVQSRNVMEKLMNVFNIPTMTRTDLLLVETLAPEAKVGAQVFGQTASAVEGRYYSMTNVQVQGIDEADIVKTDGTYIYLLKKVYEENTLWSRIYVIKAYPPEEADIVNVIEIPNITVSGIYVYNELLIAIGSRIQYNIVREYRTVEIDESIVGSIAIEHPYNIEQTKLLIYNVSSGTPALVFNTTIDGWEIGSRLYNGTLYIITSLPVYDYEGEIIIPTINGREIAANRIIAPKDDMPEKYVIVYRLDLDRFMEAFNAFILEDASDIYMSYTSLYIMHRSAYAERIVGLTSSIGGEISLETLNETIIGIINNESMPMPQRIEMIIEVLEERIGNETTTTIMIEPVITVAPRVFWEEETIIYRFAINDLNMTYIGKANVPGYTLDPFSYSEYNNLFYIATHVWSNDSNSIYVVNITTMEIIGKLENIEPGMDIYAARFMGTRAYLITYRRRDPLIVIDLSNPYEPIFLGKLLMPGYSEYLHPLSDTILLGIGFTDDMSALKIETYDVSDPENPRIISTINIGEGPIYSPIIHDYHAFTIDLLHMYFLVPAEAKYANVPSGFYVISFTEEGVLQLKGAIPLGFPRRSIYIEDTIYAIGENEIVIARSDTLDLIKTIVISI